MNGIQQWLQLFDDTSCFYRYMVMLPLWNKYPAYQNNRVDSVAIFLEGYAFERQGRRPDYFHVGVDSLRYCVQQNTFDANCIWNRFQYLLNNQNLNHRRNPLYPSNNPDNIGNITNQFSIIEAILEIQDNSLSAYIRNMIIQSNDINGSFSFLKTIRGIGDKIASFYLRDLVSVLNVNVSDVQNRLLLQPIDVWVKRTVQILTANQNMNKRQIANWIVTNSLTYNFSPEHINMGIWFYCALIANSEYRLNQSLQNIDCAKFLINYYRAKINSVCQYCQIA